MANRNLKFTVYKDSAREWRWRATAVNGKNIACSGESFYSKNSATRAVKSLIKTVRECACTISIRKDWM